MKRRSPEEVTQIEHERAAKEFSKHQIVSRDDRSWTLHRPYEKGDPGWDWTFWFEVIVNKNGTMIVHGDFDLVMFGHYGKFTNPEQVVRWMGATKDFGYYVRQKAVIGMGSARDCLTAKSDDAFLDRLLDFIENDCDAIRPVDENDDSGKLGPIPDFDNNYDLRDYLLSRIDVEKLPQWTRELTEEFFDGAELDELLRDTMHGAGHELFEAGVFEWADVPSSRLVYAYQALRRLVQLLDEEHAAARKQREESVGDGG